MRAEIRLLVLILTSAASAGILADEAGISIEFKETIIQSPFGATTIARGINDRNQIAGTFSITEFGDSQVFVFSAKGEFIPYRAFSSNPDLGDSATDINNRGTVVGVSQVLPLFSGSSRAVRWTSRNKIENLGVAGAHNGIRSSGAAAINERGHIVGSTTSPAYARVAFLWTRRSDMEVLGTLGGALSHANDINDHGAVVGNSTVASGDTHAFIWTRHAGMQDLGVLPGGSFFSAEAINNWGQVVGSYQRGDCRRRPFLWTRQQGMKDLGGDKCGEALDINDWGVIAGTRILPSIDFDSGIPHAALWDTQGNTLDLTAPSEDESSSARALNNRNVSVGVVRLDLEGVGRAAKWTPIFP